MLSLDDRQQLEEKRKSDGAQLLLWGLGDTDKSIYSGIKEIAEIRKICDIPIIVVCRKKVGTDRLRSDK